MKRQTGFTLLEVLVALVIFTIIAAFAFAVTMPAGEGFKELQNVRDRYMQAYALGRQMRLDVTALATTKNSSLASLELVHDVRSGLAFDRLKLLVREANRPSLSIVSYYLDESGETPELIRGISSSIPRKVETQPLHWRMGKVKSFEIQAMLKDGRLVDTWDSRKKKQLPAALKLSWKDVDGEQELVFPIFVQISQQNLSPAGLLGDTRN